MIMIINTTLYYHKTVEIYVTFLLKQLMIEMNSLNKVFFCYYPYINSFHVPLQCWLTTPIDNGNQYLMEIIPYFMENLGDYYFF